MAFVHFLHLEVLVVLCFFLFCVFGEVGHVPKTCFVFPQCF